MVGCSTTPLEGSGCIKTSVITTLSRSPLYTALEEDSRIATLAIEKVECDKSKNARSEGNDDIGLNLILSIPAARKDMGSDKKVVFPVFVALLNREDVVIDRYDEMINVHVNKAALSHTHKINYHLPEGVSAHNEDYRILVGFYGSVRTAQADAKYSAAGKKAIHKTVSKKKNKRKS